MKETPFQIGVADYLAIRRFRDRDVQYCHVPNETPLGLRMEQAQKKRMGVVAGAPDFVIWPAIFINPYWVPVGTLATELKSTRGNQSRNQKTFEGTLTRLGYAYIVIHALDTVERSVAHFAQTLDDYIINAALSLSD